MHPNSTHSALGSKNLYFTLYIRHILCYLSIFYYSIDKTAMPFQSFTIPICKFSRTVICCAILWCFSGIFSIILLDFQVLSVFWPTIWYCCFSSLNFLFILIISEKVWCYVYSLKIKNELCQLDCMCSTCQSLLKIHLVLWERVTYDEKVYHSLNNLYVYRCLKIVTRL